MRVRRVHGKRFSEIGVALVVKAGSRQIVRGKQIGAPIIRIEFQRLANGLVRFLVRVLVGKSISQFGVTADLLRIQSDGLPGEIDRGINPRCLPMESRNPFDIRTGQTGIGQREFWIQSHRLLKQIDRLLVILLSIELVECPPAEIEIVGG